MPNRWYEGAEKRASGSANGIESESCNSVLLVRQNDIETYQVDYFPPWTVGYRCGLDVVALALSLVSHLTLDSHQLRS